MIEGFDGMYTLTCDICDEDSGENFDSFYEAVEWKKDRSNGWISQKTKDGWNDVCCDCQESEEKDV